MPGLPTGTLAIRRIPSAEQYPRHLPADSVLEDCQVQISRAAPISAITVRSPSTARKSVTGPTDQQLLAR